ncbi:putative membrane protein [Flavimobilis soli]|uniref:Putative membrane protein n=1 Tax=Flavimobilis soli TaxID=442709 RepID=A0A2A9ED30_9MICO|nr:DUF2231 domain-containing protein [Flavimobilis soli]PFG36713.1 putative membrane protein [Flavimobilis soli]
MALVPTPAELVSSLEESHALDGAASVVEGIALAAHPSATERDVAQGAPVGHPVHAALSDVPVGTWISSVLLDVLHPRDGHAARTLLGVAVVSSLPTAYLGLADYLRLDRSQKRVATVHMAANSGALALGVASLWARRSDPTRGKLLSFAGASLLGAGGFLGGHLAARLGPPEESPERASSGRPLGQLATTDEIPD